MRSVRLYCPDLHPGTVDLPAAEAHHAVASLRLGPGAEVLLFDGRGHEAKGCISQVARHRVQLNVADVMSRPFESACRVTLAVAAVRAHRQAYLIEKCTELGVFAIRPIITERSTVRPSPAAVEKWRRRAIEAAKQAGRAWVPDLRDARSFPDALADLGDYDLAIFADVQSTAVPLLDAISSHGTARSAIVFVGPEGGWTDTERVQANAAGVLSVRLASTTLRTETAGVAVCAILAAFYRGTPSTVS